MTRRIRRWAVMAGLGVILAAAGGAWATQPADANIMHRPVRSTL